tara:strand:+ start:1243 stop:1824 length:582 start_codon:yes stop_codon:yes gene_type:complete
MKNNIMQTINNMYKSNPTLEETEISKLESLLTQVGGNAKNILLSAEEYTLADFIDMCIRNGITFELRKDVVDASHPSETASVSNDNPSPMQSPSDSEKPSEDGCEEASPPLTRITLDNWRELLSVGDEVVSFINNEIIFGVDGRVDNRLFWKVTDLEGSGYGLRGFMELNHDWVYLEDDNTCEDGREYYVEKD